MGGIPVIKGSDRRLASGEKTSLRREVRIPLSTPLENIRVEVESAGAIGLDETYLQDSQLAERDFNAASGRTPQGILWVLAIGIEDFSTSTNGGFKVRQLPNTPNDADLLRKVLLAQGGKLFKEVRATTLSKRAGYAPPTSKNILAALAQLEKAAPEDTTVVFYRLAWFRGSRHILRVCFGYGRL